MEKKTILVVEDDDVVRDLIKEVLAKKYRVLEAARCREAKGLLPEEIDLAIVDYELPDGNGLDVLQSLNKATPGLPVILMTAYSTENLAIRAVRAAVRDYIKKPFRFSYLTARVSDILEGMGPAGESENIECREVFVMDGIAAFIEDNLNEPLDRDRLAEKAGMSASSFSKAFNDRFGMGVRSYLNTVRTRRAAELLRGGNLKVAEVAFSVGYGSVDHFTRVFRETYGISPKEFQAREPSCAGEV